MSPDVLTGALILWGTGALVAGCLIVRAETRWARRRHRPIDNLTIVAGAVGWPVFLLLALWDWCRR